LGLGTVSIATATRQTAQINGLSMSWLEWPNPGKSGKCTIVLLHGILQSADEQSHIARHLSRFHHVVYPDLRGRGQTEMPDGPCDPATIATDVAALIQHLGLERVVVIGRNHGGGVGYHLAANNPDLVHGLVLGDCSPEISPERAARRMKEIAAIPRSFDSLEAVMSFYQDDMGVSAERARHDIPNDLSEIGGVYTWRHNLDHVARIEAACCPRDDWDVVARIQAPTLALVGQRSHIARATVNRMSETIPRCEAQVIVGSGPDVYLGRGAEQTRGAIDMFLIRLNGDDR
jgi:pimeloyl-ACP methyl ester carboxylesterase